MNMIIDFTKKNLIKMKIFINLIMKNIILKS